MTFERTRKPLAAAALLVLLAIAFSAGRRDGLRQTDNGSGQGVAPPSANAQHARAAPGRDEARETSRPTSTQTDAVPDEAVRDPEAAARLAVHLDECWTKQVDRAAASNPDHPDASGARPADDCKDLGRITMQRVRAAWSNAAALGSRDAEYHFAAQPLFNPVNPGGDIDYLRDWHDRSPGYMNAAADTGDARAALALGFAYDARRDEFSIAPDAYGTSPADWSTQFGQAQPADAAVAYRYYLLDRLLGDDSLAQWRDAALTRLAAQLTPLQVAEAERWARSIAARAH